MLMLINSDLPLTGEGVGEPPLSLITSLPPRRYSEFSNSPELTCVKTEHLEHFGNEPNISGSRWLTDYKPEEVLDIPEIFFLR